MRFNRDVVRTMLETGAPLAGAKERAVGKTTGAIFAALGESYARPGQWVRVDDPDANTPCTRDHLVRHIHEVLVRLDLRFIEAEERWCPVQIVRPAAPRRWWGDPDDRLPDFDKVRAVFVRNRFAEAV